MATLTFLFYGTCIHLPRFRPYRVVVPAGRVPSTGYTLSPSVRIAGLEELGTLPKQPNEPFALEGARFTIGSLTTGAPDYRVNLPCVPHLAQIWPDMALGPGVVFNQDQAAGAYFDFLNGTIEGVVGGGPSAYARVTVDVPDPATMQVLCWNAAGVMSVTTVEIPDPERSIVINNLALPAPNENDPLEYATNFLVAEVFPKGEVLAKVAKNIDTALAGMVNCLGSRNPGEQGKRESSNPRDTFPSCSNSQWP